MNLMRTRIGVVAAILLVAGCSGSPRVSVPTSPPTPTGEAEEAAIYSVILSQGGDLGTDPYVYSRICRRLPMKPTNCQEMSDALKAALLAERPELHFVDDRAALEKEILHERDDGVLVYLGPIEREGDRAEVENGYFCGGLCAGGQTTVVELANGIWTVAGTTGPVFTS